MARIAFFGTPEFSLVALEQVDRFCRNFGHQLAMVVTQPDKEQGRGQKLLAPPVKLLASQLNLPIMQPTSLRKSSPDGDDFYRKFTDARIDLAVVVAYGKIIPLRLLSAAKVGFVNIHGSLLPRFRGAAPIQRAIEEGDKETGVCLMDMVLKLDEGAVFDQIKTPIIASDTSATLFRRLSRLGAHLLYNRLDDLLNRRLEKIPQEENNVCYAHMLTKEEGLLSFANSGRVLSWQVRAFDQWPHSYGYIKQKRVKFFDSFFIASSVHRDLVPGTIVVLKPFLGVKTIDGILYFQRMQVEGKTVLQISEALRGFPLNVGEKISSIRE